MQDISFQRQVLRQKLRQLMRNKRLNLDETQQIQASKSIVKPALVLIEKYQATKIAFYFPSKNEISPLPLIDTLFEQGKRVYFPVLHPFSKGNLLFIEYKNRKNSLKYNRFGILEPCLNVKNVLPLNQLEMIFVPLVACDQQGNRLGMGGGFYDRTLKQASSNLVSVGLAYQFQSVKKLPIESWDMPLDYILLGE